LVELQPRYEERLGPHLALRSCTGTIERWLEVPDEAALAVAVKLARAEKWVLRPFPPFADALPPAGGLVGLGLRLGQGFEDLRFGDGVVCLGAAAPLALAGRLPGFEALRSAPGTVDEAIEEGWIAPMVTRVRRFRGRGFEEVESAAPEVRALVVRAWLRPAKVQPPRAGAAFCAPRRRGVTLGDLVGSLGPVRLGGAALAGGGSAVLVNRGDATPAELKNLVTAVVDRVKKATGIELELRLQPPGRGGRVT
jgi:hypothetical protein